jgi:peptidoglycan/LPS O-acetylase OafA/YrhL
VAGNWRARRIINPYVITAALIFVVDSADQRPDRLAQARGDYIGLGFFLPEAELRDSPTVLWVFHGCLYGIVAVVACCGI